MNSRLIPALAAVNCTLLIEVRSHLFSDKLLVERILSLSIEKSAVPLKSEY